VSDVASIISQLEQQKAAIDRAIDALRGITPLASSGETRAAVKKAPAKQSASDGSRPHITPEGRRALAEAMKRRWAAKRASAAGGGRKAAGGSSASTAKKSAKKVATKKSRAKRPAGAGARTTGPAATA